MIREISWTGLKGQNIRVTVELQTKKTANLDGDKFETDCCEKSITAKVDGIIVGYVLRLLHPPKGLPGLLVARIGNLGLTQSQYDDIKEAIKEIESTPEWLAKLKREAEAEAVELEYQRAKKVVDDAMSL